MREHQHASRLLAASLAACLLLACSGPAAAEPVPLSATDWAIPADLVGIGRAPQAESVIEIRGTGSLGFDPSAVATTRPDTFTDGHFSVFDVLVHLAAEGLIEMTYSYDEELRTHVIETLNGLEGWWYDAHFEGGTFDRAVVRMDQFPIKDGMSITVYLEDPERLDAIHQYFREEIERLVANEEAVVIPTVTILSSTETITFESVAVTPHNTRSDVFQPGTLTMLDVLLSLGEQGYLSELSLEWRDSDDTIAVVDGFYVTGIAAEGFAPEAVGACVLTHQIGGAAIADYLKSHTHTTSHIHLTGDLEMLVSPEAVGWLWVCL